MKKRTCSICGRPVIKDGPKSTAQCEDCRAMLSVDRYRGHRGTSHPDDRPTPFKVIAKELGFKNASSAHFIYRRAMAKLRRALENHREEIRSLYTPDSESSGYVGNTAKPLVVSQMTIVPIAPCFFKIRKSWKEKEI